MKSGKKTKKFFEKNSELKELIYEIKYLSISLIYLINLNNIIL